MADVLHFSHYSCKHLRVIWLKIYATILYQIVSLSYVFYFLKIKSSIHTVISRDVMCIVQSVLTNAYTV